MNIYLVGYRGTGKSTVAPIVARKLGQDWDWIDMDSSIEHQAERSIAAIFSDEGETGFRDRESRVLADLSTRDRLIVATGGGVVLREENRAVLAQGYVVWLTGSPERLWSRLAADPASRDRRPNLTPSGGVEEVRNVLASREKLYQSVASLTLSTESEIPEAIADSIVANVQRLLMRGGR